jgi:hypothetical protein
MDTEYLIIDDHTQCQEIEHICKVMPHIRIPIFPGTLSIEPIRLRHTPRLMIPSDQMHSMRVS